MHLNFYHSKLITIIIIALLSMAALIFIFLNPPANEKNNNCHQINLPYQNPTLSIDQRVTDLMNRMTVAEKIGQMVLIEKNSLHDINDITQYNLGALLSGGGAGPTQDTPLAWLKMISEFQSAAKNTCLGIPLLYGIDAIHGHGNVLGATIFPHSIGLGATRDADLVKRVAKATAEEMAATGIYWNLMWRKISVGARHMKLLDPTQPMWRNWDWRIWKECKIHPMAILRSWLIPNTLLAAETWSMAPPAIHNSKWKRET